MINYNKIYNDHCMRKLQEYRLKLYNAYVEKDLLEVRKAYVYCCLFVNKLGIEKPDWLMSIEKYYTYKQLHNIPDDFEYKPTSDKQFDNHSYVRSE